VAVQTLIIENIVRNMNKVKTYAVELVKVDKAAEAVQKEVPRANRAMSRTGTAANQGAQGATVLARRLGKVAIAYASIATAQKVLQTGIRRAESERRIKFLAEGYGEAEQLALAASKAAKKFGQSQTEANSALATAYARLRPVGASLKDIESVYAGFNTAARLSGSSAVEAAGAFRQLAQALGSGTLRGDEFNSIAEQVPSILTAISKETGIAQGKLRDYAADGMITAEVMIRALKRIEKEGADQLAAAMGGPAQATKNLQNVFEDLAVAVSKYLVPEMADSMSMLGTTISNLEGPIRAVGRLLGWMIGEANKALMAVNAVFGARLEDRYSRTAMGAAAKGGTVGNLGANVKGSGIQDLENLVAEVNRNRGGRAQTEAGLNALQQARSVLQSQWGDANKAGGTAGQERIVNLNKQITQAQTALTARLESINRATQVQPTAAPDTANIVAGAKGGGGGGGGANAAQKAAEKQARLDAQRAESTKRLTTEIERQFEIKNKSTDLEKEVARINHDYVDTLVEIGQVLDVNEQARLKSLATAIKQLDIAEATADAEETRAAKAKRAAEEAKRAAEAAKGDLEKYTDQLGADLANTEGMIVQMATTVENAMAQAMSTAVMGVIDGTKTAEEAFAQMFKQIGAAFIQMATQMIAKALILKALNVMMPGPGMNDSGYSGGFGHDFWFPKMADGGYVTGPTNALIGEGGEPEYVIPESKMGDAMARYSQGATGEQVLDGPASAQSSPAGGMGTPEVVIQGGVLNFDGSQYIKQDQAPALVMQGAALGEQRALKRLRMSPGARRKVGI